MIREAEAAAPGDRHSSHDGRAAVLVVADDLTGANATGVLFTRRHLRTISVPEVSSLRRFAGDFDVLVMNTASRHAPAAEAAERVRAAVEAAGPVRLVVKRIDTTLRGNVGAELDAALGAVGERADKARALMVPAFPPAGRTTVGGLQLVDGVALTQTDAARDPFTPVRSARVSEIVAAQCDRSVSEVPLDVVMASGERLARALRADADVLVCDAVTPLDLITIAEAAVAAARAAGITWLSVDPGPFGAELAEAMGIASSGPPPDPILVVAGSVTRTTRDQLLEVERLLRGRFLNVDVRRLDVDEVVGRTLELLKAAPPGAIVGIRTAAEEPDVVEVDAEMTKRIPEALGEVTRRTLEQHAVGGLYVTGGDVITGVAAALGAEGIQLEEEVVPLAVAGRLVGGPFHGLPLATKGGLVGGPLAAVACVEVLKRKLEAKTEEA